MALLGENERAAAYFEESLEVRRRIGDLSRIALSLANVAAMALQEGETTKAAAMFAEAAEIATAIGDKRHILFALAGLGRVAYREERWEDRRDAHTGKPAPRARTRHEATRGGTDPRPRRDRHGHGRHRARSAARSRRRSPPVASRTRWSRRRRVPGRHRARESGLRPRDVGASLGRGSGDDPRRGRGLRTLLRLLYESAAQTSNGCLSVVLTGVRTPSSETERTVCPV